MLSHYYNRKSSIEVPKRDVHVGKEDDIVNSFYEERRSRSFNTKHHNLLKKNLSYFHRASSEKEDLPGSSCQQSSSYDNSPINRPLPTTFQPKQGNGLSKINSKPFTPLQTVSPIKDKQDKHEESSAFSSIGLTIQKPMDESYKQHLKNQLHKRINIKHYLTEISQQNKQNDNSITNDFRVNHMEYSRDKSFGHSFERLKILKADHSIVPAQLSRISYNNADSRSINESRHSIEGTMIKDKKEYVLNLEERTDRTQTINRTTFGSDKTESRYRRSLVSYSESGMESNRSKQLEKQQKFEQINVLLEQELTSLNENSHPLREINENTFKQAESKRRQDYFDPEEQNNYKRRIADLQKEMSELKAQKQREEKFIQSIFRMRRVMLETKEDCSLKQLWRWIKQLPNNRSHK